MGMKKAIAAPFTKGVNFTNWLEFKTAEQIDASYFTRQDFENAKKLGCDVVRLPIHFEKICEGMPDYEIPEKVFGILDNVAAWAEELQMYVIFDFHNATDTDSRTSDDVESVLTPIWKQVATRYQDATEYLIFELMNEPHGIDVPLWNGIIERVFKMVRSIDRKHYIVAGGADWNSFAAMKTLPDFQDDKVIYTFHFYDPHTFTHQGAPWCHMERVTGIPFPYDADKMPPLPENPTELEKERFADYPKHGTLDAVIQYFDQYVEFSVERNAPVFCGEFGCFIPFIEHEQRVNWYSLVTGLLKERGIARTSWDYYGGFGLFKKEALGFGPQGERKLLSFPEDLDMDVVKALGLSLEVNE
ncbi:MAG: glycoside hydrolase family 5 protein [Lachnospiraceae bacterium]|nr:glycoside hydrolase family 5 protein [Lachnospiraceae bacterium]